MAEISYGVSMIFSIAAPVVTMFIIKNYYRNKCTREVDGYDIVLTLMIIVFSIFCGAFIGVLWFIIVPNILIGTAIVKFIFPDKTKKMWKDFKKMVTK